jgi:putative membrane protein
MALTAVDRLFSADDRGRVRDAVREAERGTSGEVVVVITEASDEHAAARWRLAFALAGAVLIADIGYRHFATFWIPWNPDGVWLAAVAAAGLGFLAASWPPLRRALAGGQAKARAARHAAEAAFAREGVFETRDRTGILIFLSLLEHQVVVLPDAGIAAKAPEDAWAGVVRGIVLGMKAGRPAEALVVAVRSCGEILLTAGFTARPEDTNEMPDEPRFR